MATITMKELLEAGVHFGHQTKRWNPKMKEYIFGERNGIYIIDLQKTLKMFKEASKFVTDLTSTGKLILFVGTKRQAQDAVAEEATRAGMPYINSRWLGGLLTNWVTVQNSDQGPTIGSAASYADDLVKQDGRWMFRYRKIDRFIHDKA